MERGGLPWRLPRQATPACSVVRLAYSWPAAWMSSAMAVAGSPMSNAWSALAISEGQFAGERPAMAAACATSRATATIASTRAAVSAREPRSAPMADELRQDLSCVTHRTVGVPVHSGKRAVQVIQRGTDRRVTVRTAEAGHRSEQPGPAGVGAKAPAERVQRLVVRVAHVDRYLCDGTRPGHRQPSGEGAVAEQHIGHACAFAAGQPRCDQCVDLTELVGEHLRASGDHEHHAFADGAADLVHDGPVAGLQGE